MSTTLFILGVLLVLVPDACSKVLYHYTDEPGSKLIIGSGYIKSSTDGLFGAGVYLTAYSPWSKSREDIAYNNWANTAVVSKTKCVYEVDISGAVKQSSKRDIYLYKGGDIFFKETNDWNLYDWTSDQTSLVIGKQRQCFVSSPCVQNGRRKRSTITDNFATCSGQMTKRNTIATIVWGFIVCLLLVFI